MANNAVQQATNEILDLLVDMRTTNVARGLKVEVHEDWIKRLNNSYDILKVAVPDLLKKADELEELSSSASLAQDVATQVKAKRK
jgi:hypothetical protein